MTTLRAHAYDRNAGHLPPAKAAADAARLVEIAAEFQRTRLKGGCVRPGGGRGLESLKDLVNEEGRGYFPPRSGFEVDLYRRMKAALASGQRLDPELVFEMALETCASEKEVSLQDVFLTIHNVVRLLARPETWWNDYTYARGRLIWTPAGEYEVTQGHWEPGWRGMQKDTAFPIIRDIVGHAPVYGLGPTLSDLRGNAPEGLSAEGRAKREASLALRRAGQQRRLDESRAALGPQKAERGRLAQEIAAYRQVRTGDVRTRAAFLQRLESALERQDAHIADVEGTIARLQDQLGNDITGRAVSAQYTQHLFDVGNGVFAPLYGAEDALGNGGNWYYFWLGAMVDSTAGGAAGAFATRYEAAQKWLGAEEEYARGLVQLSHFSGGAELGRQVRARFAKCPPPATPTPTPTPTTPTRALPTAAAHWRYVGPRPEKSKGPGTPSSLTVAADEGSITLEARYGPEEPSTFAVDCAWRWSAPQGLDRLVPGETLTVSMTVVDRSTYFRTYDGYDHGYAGGTGVVRLDKPGLPLGIVWENAIDVLSAQVGYRGKAPQDGRVVVPAGPLWDGRMALKASCPGGLFERVYEWVPAGR